MTFETELVAEKIKEASNGGRAVWRLERRLVFVSRVYGRINVPPGFETDFASVPRLPFAYWLTGDTAHKSAVVHDFLCRHDFKDCYITWKTAAEVFREAMKVEGVPLWRRTLMYWGVCLAPQKRDCEK